MALKVEVKRDTEEMRERLNVLASARGFRIATTDERKPGIDRFEITFTDRTKAAGLRVTLDRNNHPNAISGDLGRLLADLRSEISKRQRQLALDALDSRLIYQFEPEIDAGRLGLSEPYAKYLGHLKKIAHLTARLIASENDADWPARYARVKENGSPEQLALYLHQLSANGCGPYVADPENFCSPDPDYAPVDPNGTAWPDYVRSQDQVAGRGDAVNSAYTVVSGPMDNLSAVSYVDFDPYKQILLKIAVEFEAASLIEGIDDGLKAVSLAYARACRGKGKNKLRPFDEAELVWTSTKSPVLTFTFGPMEEFYDPLGAKRRFQFVVYRVDPELDKMLDEDRESVGRLNEFLRSRGVNAPEVTQAQQNRVIHVGDVVFAVEGGRHRTTLAQTLPNDGLAVDRHGKRVDVATNLAGAIFDQIMVPIRDRIIHPSQRHLVQKGHFLGFLGRHELAHSSGFMLDHQPPDGGGKTLNQLLGAAYFGVDEGRVNMGAAVASGFKWSNDDTKLSEYYLTYVDNLIRQIRLPANASHSWGARNELGKLFSVGAVELKIGEDGEKYIYTNIDRMRTAMENVFVEATAVIGSGKRAMWRFSKRNITTTYRKNSIDGSDIPLIQRSAGFRAVRWV